MADYVLYHQHKRSKRNKDDRMYFKRFQQGDSVTYVGGREDFKDLRGKEGHVVARVGGTEQGVTVEFDGDTYIMNEQEHLSKYVKRERPENTDKGKGPAVEKRRGVSEGKGGGKKRRNQEEG